MEMNWLQALILGIIEGVTEFLPVSSTGHLVVAQRLLGIGPSEAANAFAIVIQAGAILAIIGLYRTRIIQMVRGLLGKDPQGVRLILALVVAFLPAAILGLSFDEVIERNLFGAWPVVGAWIAGGLLILGLGSRLERRAGLHLEQMRLSAALLIGLAQCAALWPGVSRSLATILGGLAVGLALDTAVEFSFLLGLITLGAATGYKAISSGSEMVAAFGLSTLVIGFIAAFVSAVVAVHWMVSWLQTRGLRIFAWWRIGMALAVLAMLYAGWL
jgi:undecaprenyl-diphosphatase